MTETEKSTRSQADVAHFYRALGRAGSDGMVMPFEVHFQAGDRVMLRYRTVEDVDAALAHIGGRAGHENHTHRQGATRTWHSYGTGHGGGHGTDWSGWPVEVWAAVDGPAPVVHETRVEQMPGGPIEVRCSCGQWGGVAPSIQVAERDAAKHRAENGGQP